MEQDVKGLTKQTILYLRIMRHYLGLRLYVFILLNFLSVVVESLGILLFIPFFKTLDMGGKSSDKLSLYVSDVFNFLGLELTITNTLILLVSTFILKGLIIFAISVYRLQVNTSLRFNIRESLVKNYSTLDYRYSTTKGTGFFGHLVISEVDGAIQAINALTRTISGLITSIVFITTALLIHPQLSLITALAGAFNLFLLRFVSKIAQDFSRKSSREGAHFNSLLIELLHSVKYLKATAQFAPLKSLIRASNEFSSKIALQHSFINSAYDSIREPMIVAIMSATIYYYIVVQDQSFAMIAVPILILYRCMQEIGFLQANWQGVCNASGPLTNLYNTENAFEKNQEQSGTKKDFSFKTALNFKNVDFSYGNHSVFSDLSVSIPKHSSVALVGASGAGKTTFVDLLTGILVPQNGNVLVDDVPLCKLNLEIFRSKIGYVVQDPVIFSDTLANNISMKLGRHLDDITLEKVSRVAKLSHVEEFVKDMPEGFLTHVGERGVRLSGGQKQRLAIARELFKEPEILIFDESTSALDARSEKFVQDSIAMLRGSLTVLIISHRLSSVSNVDRILYIENGKIIEDGSLDELLSLPNSHFRNLYGLKKAV